jgi:transcriptional repressor NrdR
MRCPFCGFEESKVTDSRSSSESNCVRRRRECLKCQNRFTTFETVDLIVQVLKRNGTYEDFNESKLVKGLEAACCHTKISHDQIRQIVSQIASDLMAAQIRVVSTKELGEKVMARLKEIDMVAYIRFACVYRRFKDIDEVVEAIESAKSTN